MFKFLCMVGGQGLAHHSPALGYRLTQSTILNIFTHHARKREPWGFHIGWHILQLRKEHTWPLVVVESLNCIQLLVSPWIAACQAPLPSLSPRVCSNSCSLSLWCHSIISSSVATFSSCCQSFPASGSFPARVSSHQLAKVLELQLQHLSFPWIFRIDFL